MQKENRGRSTAQRSSQGREGLQPEDLDPPCLLVLLGEGSACPHPSHTFAHPNIISHPSPITLRTCPHHLRYLFPSSCVPFPVTSHTFLERGRGSNDRNHVKAFPSTVRDKDIKSLLLAMEIPPPKRSARQSGCAVSWPIQNPFL